jgi:eukaryotic translation initiation factor 2C
VVGEKLLSDQNSFSGVASNLSLKVNMKFGGDHHRMDTHRLNYLLGSERRNLTIIIGADVVHPAGGGKFGAPSIACVIGSVDSEFMNYPGSMRLQGGNQEVRKREISSEAR